MKNLFILLFAFAATIASAQTVTFNGQIRERSEVDAKSMTVGTKPDVFHLLRTRFNVMAKLDSQVSAFVELQDARTFGQTRSTLNVGSPSFDLRQAFIDARAIAGTPFSVKLGRQAVAYADERILGAIDWSNLGQSFDGAVANVSFGDVSIDALGLAIARNANTSAYNRDVFLTGAWAAWKAAHLGANVQAYYLFDTPKADSLRQNRHTAGIYSSGKFSGFDYELDGAMQFGDYIIKGKSTSMIERTIAAMMVGARAGYTLPDIAGLRIGAGYDRLSGNSADNPDQYGAFNTLYATNHKYYGYMDYFTNIPAATKGMGLQDIIAQVSIAPAANVKLAADLHLFSLASDPKTLNPALPESASSAIGNELDLTVTFKPIKALGITAGYSVFDANRDRVILPGRKTTQWGYVMTAVNF